MVEPVVAAAVAWVWLEEVLNGVQIIGGALVLLGVGLVQARPSPAPVSELIPTAG